MKQTAKVTSNNNLDESRTVVSGGGNATGQTQEVISISSRASSSEDDADDSLDEDEAALEASEDVTMGDAEAEVVADEGEEGGEPTLGDLVLANNSEVIDVAGAFEDLDSKALTYPTKIQPPSGASLGTVLTQALKTNDTPLLESCLHTTDTPTIRATIQRLDSTLAGTLLQKLAERLHKRPGRAGSLTVWVQWTLVTHGGFLATQPDLIKKLAGLNRVMEERAKGLTSLLSLKGKLDMLEAQTELRKSLQTQRRRAEEDDNEDDVIYVEGQDSEDENAVQRPKRLIRNGADISDDESDLSEDLPIANGIIDDSDDEEEESDEEGFLDDEAEETDADTGDEDEVDHDDQDSQDEEEESEDGGPPPSKLQRVGNAFNRKR